MIFNSVTYLLFLTLTVCMFWALPRRPRLLLVMLASLTFYGFWRPEYLVVMLASAMTDYVVALKLDKTEEPRRRKFLLAISLTVNLGLLFYFKYLFFFTQNAWSLLAWVGFDAAPPVLNILLPLGISFYTFATISYVVDVYRRHIPAERDPVLYICFVTFFPHLVAGPILRASAVLHQLARRPVFRLDEFVSGLRRIIFGLFLKVVFADNIAPLVDAGFSTPLNSLSALDVWTLAFLFGFQIYFDFSAYSHIAIGSARLMGVQFPENFNFPYLATSPRDFWRRWHISLSSWIRDYLYLPLLGVKVHDTAAGGISVPAAGERQAGRNPTLVLFASWAIMGLWHGANWTFLLWGLYHATMIAAYRALPKRVRALPEATRRYAGIAVTLPLMMLSWIPFRAASLSDALTMMAMLLKPSAYSFLGMRENTYLIAALLTVGVLTAGWLYSGLRHARSWRPVSFAVDAALAMVMVPLAFVFLRPISQFIYFQF